MLDLSKIKAITLDLDDTLWPILPTIERCERLLHTWLQEQAPATALLLTDPHVRRELRETTAQQWPDLAHDLASLRREAIRMALQRAGDEPDLAEPAFAVFHAARMQVDLFEDARPGLASLAQRYPILALSNGSADVHQVGIGEYFKGSVSARDAGVSKPDARIFQLAAQTLGVAVGEVLHVGDDAMMDVVGALNAGMQTVWVNRADHLWSQPQHPHATVASMTELCDLLEVPAS